VTTDTREWLHSNTTETGGWLPSVFFSAPPKLTRELRVVSPETRCGGTSCTTETAIVDKPAEEEDHGHGHHGHAH
jgi:hypothetical protein